MNANKREEILLKAKQILFNTEMVMAILEGRKTVTRRIVKNNPTSKVVNGVCKICDDKGGFYLPDDYVKARSPYQTGDILYVRETYTKYQTVNYVRLHDGRSFSEVSDGRYAYKADGFGSIEDLKAHIRLMSDCSLEAIEVWEDKWHPSIHMPKEAARIFLRVTNVRMEMLQAITEEDVYKEGWSKPWCAHKVFENYPDSPIPCDASDGSECPPDPPCNHSVPELFGTDIWDKTVKKSDLDRYGWDANPWVWVIEFERLEEVE